MTRLNKLKMFCNRANAEIASLFFNQPLLLQSVNPAGQEAFQHGLRPFLPSWEHFFCGEKRRLTGRRVAGNQLGQTCLLL